MKKLLIILLCFIFFTVVFVACDNGDAADTETEAVTEAATETETEAETEESKKGGTGITIGGGSTADTPDTPDTTGGGGNSVIGGEAGEGLGELADDIYVMGGAEK